MYKFYSYRPYNGSTPIIHPSEKANWDITARAKSAKVEVARFGVQSNTSRVYVETHRMAMSWSPKWARSYSILSFRHTDYYDLPVEAPTGYACFSVIYYSRKDEGRFVVTMHRPVSWDNFTIVPTYDTGVNLNTIGSL